MNKEANNIGIQDSTVAAALSVGQLRGLIREEIKRIRGQNGPGWDRLLTPEQLAKRLNVPISWVYEQSRQGHIPTHRLGRYIRFDLHEVLTSLEKKD